MRKRSKELWNRLSWVDKTFLALVAVYALLRVTALAPGWQVLTALAMFGFGVAVAIRWGRILTRKAIWRLRNRLIVAYLFVAVVPIVLILTLAGLSVYVLVGQVGAYFVRTALSYREASVLRQAEQLVRLSRAPREPGGNPAAREGRGSEPARRTQRTPPQVAANPRSPNAGIQPPPMPGPGDGGRFFGGRFGGSFGGGGSRWRDPETMLTDFADGVRRSFPGAEILISGQETRRYPAESTLTPPPAEWGRANGLIVKDKRLYLWAHAVSTEGEARTVTILAPVTNELLEGLVPGLGDINIPYYLPPPAVSRLPKPTNALDVKVGWGYPLPYSTWTSPDLDRTTLISVDTRLSSVLGIIFEQKPGQTSQFSQGIQFAFMVIVGLFLLVEIASLWAGIKISRTMTGAVHEIYQGTQHVKGGDFTYRIPVKGSDQLADLSSSFNTMTENLGQLIVVAKEKERLQSELEIAREVQNQLFPRDIPSVKTLELKGVCRPARVVSGDYYDFMSLPGSEAAFAIGDVAGKGISAALLMATIQSAMRTQLSANGGPDHHFSAAHLVSQLNRQLYANTTPEKYATFYFALYDEAKHALTYTNAGHLPPMLIRDNSFTLLNPTGTVVGAFPFAKYEERTVELQDGDILVAYTDGIVEPENPYGEMFGEDRLKDLVLRYAYADTSEIIARTMEAVTQWTGSGELQDDMTMVVARRI